MNENRGDGLKACPACGHHVARSAERCPQCGNKFYTGTFFVGLAILVALGLVFGFVVNQMFP